MNQRYLTLALLAIATLLSGCGGQSASTVPPFNRFTSQMIIEGMNEAGAVIQNPISDTVVGRDAPPTFSERIVFQIPVIAPEGGQIVVFNRPEDLQAWQSYIERLRSNSDTRRTVVYVYFNQNVLLQLNAGLTNAQAEQYRMAFEALQ